MAAAIKKSDSITTCPICSEAFSDPRVMPCFHTFCLNCIHSRCKEKQPGDKIACPLCMEECSIPETGVQGLPTNFFMEKLLCVRELTNTESESTACCMCTYTAESATEKISPATTYCLHCH